jgi:tetraacyldisaccharide 4'-kinase
MDFLWYRRHPVRFLLLPFSALFCVLVWLRRALYRYRIFASYRAPVPVVIVGNISVGGTGKTPLTAYLADLLKAHGWRPGIVSRGYGGLAKTWPQLVTPESDPRLCGDEPLLLAQHCPVAVAPRRSEAVRALLAQHDCTIILGDDGLQHYALQRDIEIAVIDAERGLGNRWCLPAGPLREAPARLRNVDMMVVRGDGALPVSGAFRMTYHVGQLQRLVDDHPEELAAWRGRKVHALVGIGNPQAFFRALHEAGLEVIPHVFADHHIYQRAEIYFDDDLPVIMTAKDAVKCRNFAALQHWCAGLETRLPAAFTTRFLELLATRQR